MHLFLSSQQRLFIEAIHLVVVYILYPRGHDIPATSGSGATGQSHRSVCTAQPQWRNIRTVGPRQVHNTYWICVIEHNMCTHGNVIIILGVDKLLFTSLPYVDIKSLVWLVGDT